MLKQETSSGHLCYLWFQFSHAKIRTVWP